jgi:hypothetical protein
MSGEQSRGKKRKRMSGEQNRGKKEDLLLERIFSESVGHNGYTNIVSAS